MTRENAIRELMEVAVEKFNLGGVILINDIPFDNLGRNLEMSINDDYECSSYSVDIMFGEINISHIMMHTIKEIGVDYDNILIADLGKVFGYINGKRFECE